MIADRLTEEEIRGLKEMFRNMDTDNSGTITYEELKEGLAKQGANLTESEVRQLMEAVSTLIGWLFCHLVTLSVLHNLNKTLIQYAGFIF